MIPIHSIDVSTVDRPQRGNLSQTVACSGHDSCECVSCLARGFDSIDCKSTSAYFQTRSPAQYHLARGNVKSQKEMQQKYGYSTQYYSKRSIDTMSNMHGMMPVDASHMEKNITQQADSAIKNAKSRKERNRFAVLQSVLSKQRDIEHALKYPTDVNTRTQCFDNVRLDHAPNKIVKLADMSNVVCIMHHRYLCTFCDRLLIRMQQD